MATDVTPAQTVDVSGLSPEAVQFIEYLVQFMRGEGGVPPALPGPVRRPRPSPEEVRRLLGEMASRPPAPGSLPPDFSRADIYDEDDGL